MADYTWKADAFDAVRIVAPNGEFEFVGSDTNEIELDGESHSRHFGTEPTIVGRWLEMRPFGGGSEWTLTLPKSKTWVIELATASGEVSIENLHGRFSVQTGSGEIHIEDCRGVFNLRSGSGDVEMENCVQTDAPAAPERTAEQAYAGSDWVPPTPPGAPPMPGMPPIPPIPPIPPVPPIGVKVKVGKGVRFSDGEEWQDYGEQWQEWGERFADQASRFAQQFSRGFAFGFEFGSGDDKVDGIHIHLGHGDIQLEDIDAQVLSAHLGSGDIQIQEGRIADLEAKSNKGDVQVENTLPTGAWDIGTRHGDLQLLLPADAYARLDAATRHGEISCDAPLVRVGRPGPGARHGGRMVGTIGEGTGDPVDIHLESQHGDINIDVDRRPSRYGGQAAERTARQTTPAQENKAKEEAMNDERTAERAGDSAANNVSEKQTASAPGQEGARNYDSQFAILQALQAGEITVAEAEALLRSV